jgi:hypothetical protein
MDDSLFVIHRQSTNISLQEEKTHPVTSACAALSSTRNPGVVQWGRKSRIEGKILPGEIGIRKYRSGENFKFCPIHQLKKVILKPGLLNNGDLRCHNNLDLKGGAVCHLKSPRYA